MSGRYLAHSIVSFLMICTLTVMLYQQSKVERIPDSERIGDVVGERQNVGVHANMLSQEPWLLALECVFWASYWGRVYEEALQIAAAITEHHIWHYLDCIHAAARTSGPEAMPCHAMLCYTMPCYASTRGDTPQHG